MDAATEKETPAGVEPPGAQLGGNAEGMEGRPSSPDGGQEAIPFPPDSEMGIAPDRGPDVEEGAEGGGQGADGEDRAGEESGGPPVSGGAGARHKPRGLTPYQISRALVAANGNRILAAKALGISPLSLRDRLVNHPQLRARWVKAGKEGIDGPETMQVGQTLDRSPDSLPPPLPQAVELAEMVSKADKIQQSLAFEKLGFSKDALQRINDLEGLANSSGQFMALSLETTQRSYYVQSLELMEVGRKLMKRLMAEKGSPDYIADDEVRAMLNKNYIELVKEGGRAYELMLTGTQAMVKMMMDSKGRESAPGATKKPGWRKVAASDRHLPDAKT